MRSLSSCTVLVVDDTETNIDILVEALGDDYQVSVAMDGMSALEIANEDLPDLILLDIMMPEMDGYAVCRSLKSVRKTRDIPVVFITAKTEMADELEGFDLGAVDYITKPISPPLVRARVKTHLKLKLAQEEAKDLLEKTLNGSIRVLADILAIVRPEAFSRSVRIKGLVTAMARDLSLSGLWRYELAALLSQIGCIGLPGTTLDRFNKGEAATAEERDLFSRHPAMGADLLAHIPRFQKISEMIRQQDNPPGTADCLPGQLPSDTGQIGAHLLRVAIDFDRLVVAGQTPEEAWIRLEKRAGAGYCMPVLKSLEKILGMNRERFEPRTITFTEISSGMVVDEDLFSASGALIAASGTELSEAMSGLIRQFGQNGDIRGAFRVLVPRGTDTV